jgi:hypothetical protein
MVAAIVKTTENGFVSAVVHVALVAGTFSVRAAPI